MATIWASTFYFATSYHNKQSLAVKQQPLYSGCSHICTIPGSDFFWGGEGGYLGAFGLGMCHWPLRAPTHYSLFLWPIVDPISVTFGQICNFHDPNLVTFYFYELTCFVNWTKNTLLFTYSTNNLVCLLAVNMKNCLTPKYLKMCDPILVTLLKMQPHYSQSSRENAAPSSGTSPLASYKEVPLPWMLPCKTLSFVDHL